MGNFILAQAATIPPPPLPVWEGLRNSWTGWNGTKFDLDVKSAGVCLLVDGVTGWHMPEFDQYLDEYASVDGARYRGERARARSVDWTLGVFGDESPDWLERDRAFWATMRPGSPGMWTVTLPDGSARSLMCRWRDSSPYSFSQDPLMAGWAVYDVSLVAEQPYWEGAPVLSPVWGNEEDPTPFTGEDDEAPSYWISGATSIGSARLRNDGDIDAPVTWTVRGRGAGVDSVSIEGDAGELGFGGVPDGSTLTISTDPTRPLALLDGVDVTGAVNPWDPRAIPSGMSAELGITLVGEGTVQASFKPRWFRAW